MELVAKKYFSLVIAFGAVLGLFIPSIGISLGALVIPSLFVLTLFTVIKIDFSKIIDAIKKPLPLLLAIIGSYIVVPSIIYILSVMFALKESIQLSLVLSALAPTLLTAPYFVSIIKGDIEFSFVVSIVVTLLSPILIPLEIYFIFGTSMDFPFMSVFTSILIIVFIPIIIVQVMKKINIEILRKVSNYESIVTASMFFIFIWAVISVNSSEILHLSKEIVLVLLLGIVQEFGIFIIIRKISLRFMSDAMSKSFAFSIAVKNTALTAGIAMLSSNELALASSIVVLLHVPMFAWIMYKKQQILS